MKKLLFSLLFFSAIAWLWIGHIIAADGSLNNISGTTTLGGSAITGVALTNGQSTATTFSNTVTVTGIQTNYSNLYFGTSGTDGSANIGHVGSLPLNRPGSVNAKTLVQVGGAEFGSHMSLTMNPGIVGDVGQLGGQNNTPAQVFLFGGNGKTTAESTNVWLNLLLGGDFRVVGGNQTNSGTISSAVAFMLSTNYTAANFAPVAGMVKVVSSNGILWKVSQLSTQLLDAAQSP